MAMTDDIWTYPKGGAVPDLADLLQAETLAELQGMSATRQDAALRVLEEGRDQAEAEARAVAADLAKKGVHFDVERLLRPSLLDRMQDKWYDVLDWWQAKPEPADAAPSDDAFFVYDLPVAITNEPRHIAKDHAEIDADVARMVDGLTRQITAQRGRAPVTFSVPEALLDTLQDEDEWSEDATIAFELTYAVAYWPPAGQPALMLSVVQEDTEHRIEVRLLAQGATAHRRLMDVAQRMGVTTS